MLKKNTSSQNSRNTRRSTPTVLKQIYPAAVKKQGADNYLLPSSEFFVVDKDSLVLSESDIFQSNLARKFGTGAGAAEDEEEDEDGHHYHDEKENLVQQLTNNLNTGTSIKRQPPILHQMVQVTSAVNDKNQLDKGLRHFSAKVCAKVEEKGVTSYNEVADDLVQEIGLEMGKCDHKNIRRRVYDALNVLMAIDIIRKEKKEIRWLGLPNEAADDLRELELERVALQERINEKSRNLREILRRCISLKNLIDRNAQLQSTQHGDKLALPFILISAARDCHVHCEMLEDRTQYFFEFNTAFQINEDIELMRLMGLDTGRIERIKSIFPKELVAQVLMLCLNNNNNNNNHNSSGSINNFNGNDGNINYLNASDILLHNSPLTTSAVNNTVFAPIINNQDLNLGDLESFSSSSLLSSSL